MKMVRLVLLIPVGCLAASALLSIPSVAAASTTGGSTDGGTGAESAIPWDVDPAMTANLSAGAVEVNEGSMIVCTIVGTDMDKYKKASDNSIFQFHGAPAVAWLESGINSGSTLTATVSGSDANTGTITWTVTHAARSLPAGETSRLYLDNYSVYDSELNTLIKDNAVPLQQQVLVKKP